MKKRVCICLAALLLAMTSCAPSGGQERKEPAPVEENALNTRLQGSSEFQPIGQNENLALLFRGDTGEFAVQNLRSGTMWYSNPQDRAADAQATGLGKTVLDAQLIVRYIDSTDKTMELNSFDDCTQNGQVQYSPIENGLRATYSIGEVRKTYLAPAAVEKERFESLILSHLDEEQRAILETYYVLQSKEDFTEEDYQEVLQQYPTIEQYDLYTLIEGMPDYVLEEIEGVLSATPYTMEDMAEDQQTNGGGPVEEGVLFTIPVEYVLEQNSLVARVVSSEITYNPGLVLSEILFLPSFGAGNGTEEGYLFLPDGSGALVDFNNGKSGCDAYQKKVPAFGKHRLVHPRRHPPLGNAPVRHGGLPQPHAGFGVCRRQQSSGFPVSNPQRLSGQTEA